MSAKDSIKNFSFVGIGRFITVIVQALFYLVLASLLEPEIYGELNVILALASTFSLLSMFGLNLSSQIYLAKGKYKIDEQIRTLFLILTSAAALILVFIEPIAALLCVALSFFSMNQYHLLGLSKYKKFMFYSILKSGTYFIIPFSLYFIFDIYGIVFGLAISHFIASIVIFRKLTIRSFLGLKKYYKILVHNFAVMSGTHLSIVVDKLLIAPLFGFFIVGIYQFNLQILLSLEALPTVLTIYLISEESKGIRHRKLSYIVVIASIILTVTAIVLAPILVPVFFEKYSDGIPALQILVISVLPLTINAIYNSKLLAKESTKIGFSAIVRIGSMLILIAILGELYGLIGLSLAVLISISANTLFLYLLYQREKQVKVKD